MLRLIAVAFFVTQCDAIARIPSGSSAGGVRFAPIATYYEYNPDEAGSHLVLSQEEVPAKFSEDQPRTTKSFNPQKETLRPPGAPAHDYYSFPQDDDDEEDQGQFTPQSQQPEKYFSIRAKRPSPRAMQPEEPQLEDEHESAQIISPQPEAEDASAGLTPFQLARMRFAAAEKQAPPRAQQKQAPAPAQEEAAGEEDAQVSLPPPPPPPPALAPTDADGDSDELGASTAQQTPSSGMSLKDRMRMFEGGGQQAASQSYEQEQAPRSRVGGGFASNRGFFESGDHVRSTRSKPSFLDDFKGVSISNPQGAIRSQPGPHMQMAAPLQRPQMSAPLQQFGGGQTPVPEASSQSSFGGMQDEGVSPGPRSVRDLARQIASQPGPLQSVFPQAAQRQTELTGALGQSVQERANMLAGLRGPFQMQQPSTDYDMSTQDMSGLEASGMEDMSTPEISSADMTSSYSSDLASQPHKKHNGFVRFWRRLFGLHEDDGTPRLSRKQRKALKKARKEAAKWAKSHKAVSGSGGPPPPPMPGAPMPPPMPGMGQGAPMPPPMPGAQRGAPLAPPMPRGAPMPPPMPSAERRVPVAPRLPLAGGGAPMPLPMPMTGEAPMAPPMPGSFSAPMQRSHAGTPPVPPPQSAKPSVLSVPTSFQPTGRPAPSIVPYESEDEEAEQEPEEEEEQRPRSVRELMKRIASQPGPFQIQSPSPG